MEIFYTPTFESLKVLLYVLLAIPIAIGIRKKKINDPNWANWIHFAVYIHFLIGASYSGIRMLTTDEINDMLIRRIFACEAWFNFACAAFYFLVVELIKSIKNR